MDVYAPESIRNVVLVGHSSSGKTSLAEAALYSGGQTNRLGTVDDGTTKSDYTDAEIDRKISISTSMLHCDWKQTKINILDAPGYADFIGDSKAAIWAADNAIVVVHAASGVEIGTDKAWGFASEFGRPVLFFVNHMDKEFADYDGVLEAVKEHFDRGVVPFQIPVNQGVGFNQIIDVYQQKLLTYATDGSGKPEASDVPAELADQVEAAREQIIEAAAESEDELTEKYLEEGELTEEEIQRGIKVGLLNRTLFPLFCGDASRNIGADLLLDFLAGGAPSPTDMPPWSVQKADSEDTDELPAVDDGPLGAVVFKTISESVGDLSFVRVFSGTLPSGGDVHNATRKVNERTGQTYILNGRDREEIEGLSAGDMGALMKLKDTHTGNTLGGRGMGPTATSLEFPRPLIRIALQPRSRGDEDKISTGLQRIHEEDPSFIAGYDPELRQIIVEGQGELHLAVVLDKLKDKFGVEVETEQPRIPYRETITSKAEDQHRHKKQTGGRGQFGEAYLRVEPRGRGDGYEFKDAVVGGAIPRNFIPAVEKGVVEAMGRGVLAGYRVVDLEVTVYDGSYHPVDSSDMAFQMAGSQAFQKAFMAAKPILLEPIYKVNVVVPEQYLGDVMGDLNSRRGRIQGIDPEGKFQMVRVEAPLAELYKYSTSLRSMTQGTGDYSMEFSHYEPVPHELTQKIIEASKEEEEE
ncbi:MAG: elongation factor G, partial [Candidatus Latescibacteria bacterium]|nr:elongation factor G [Candidatus Latescibacterota bacterium]